MNIFFLDWDVKKCAQYHCDKHVVSVSDEIIHPKLSVLVTYTFKLSVNVLLLTFVISLFVP